MIYLCWMWLICSITHLVSPKSNGRDSDNCLTSCFLSSNYQLPPQTPSIFILLRRRLLSVPLLPSSLVSSPPVWSLCLRVAPHSYCSLDSLLTLHLLCMICIKVTEKVILAGLCLVSCFVIKDLNCWRDLLCSELLNHLLFLPGITQPVNLFSHYFLRNSSLLPGILFSHLFATAACCLSFVNTWRKALGKSQHYEEFNYMKNRTVIYPRDIRIEPVWKK